MRSSVVVVLHLLRLLPGGPLPVDPGKHPPMPEGERLPHRPRLLLDTIGALLLRHLLRHLPFPLAHPPVRRLHRPLRPHPPGRRPHLCSPLLPHPPLSRRPQAPHRPRLPRHRRHPPPHLLRLFVRDGLLRQKARDLGRMRLHEATTWPVRLLTAEIRRTILDTALVHLADALSLHDCAIWMPTSPDSLSLTHHLNRRRLDHHHHQTVSIPTADSDVAEIITRKEVLILEPNSNLVRATESEPVGPAAAIRMPLLRVSKFNEGMPELVNESYAILVLVLPTGGDRVWTADEVDVVEVVADQVAVALSHAAVLEESLLMRERLMEQNMALDRAHGEALLAKAARKSLQSVMTREIVRPIRLVAALFSALQLENLNTEQLAMARAGLVLSSLIKEAADVSSFEEDEVELRFRPFHIRSVVEEIASVSRFLCACRGVFFEFHVSGGIPGPVLGDERRILQLLLYMFENFLGTGDQGTVSLQVCIEDATDDGSSDGKYVVGKQNVGQGMVALTFEVCSTGFGKEDKISDLKESKGQISFSFCRKLAEVSFSFTGASVIIRWLGMRLTFCIKNKKENVFDLFRFYYCIACVLC